jgi:hypothetical protein
MFADIVDDRLDILFEIHETFLTSGRSEAKARNRGHLFIAAAAV